MKLWWKLKPKSRKEKESYSMGRSFADLKLKEAEIRLELRRNGGHRGKISSSVLDWLEQVEIAENHLTEELCSNQTHKISFCNCYTPFKVHKYTVKLLLETSYSLVSVNNGHGIDRVQSELGLQTVVGKSALKVSNQILDYLLDPMVRMICLEGFGGVGKTTIMKDISFQLANNNITFDKIIWVTLSKNMRLERLQDDIALQLSINLPRNEGLVGRASKLLENLGNVKKCLFILDDIRETVLLSEIGIPEPTADNGCKIVLTTRIQEVGRRMGANKEIKLEPLSEDEAWGLFVCKSGNHVFYHEIKCIAKEIVKICGGLPIIINTVGHALRDMLDLAAWRLTLKNLQSTQKEVQGDGLEYVLFRLLKVGYHRLRNDQVRKCFLYCTFFPEDYKFEPNELISYWMAEEFIHNKGDIVTSIKEGNAILRELKDANMLETVTEGGTEWLKMQHLFWDLAISIMREDLGSVVNASTDLEHFPRSWESLVVKKISLVRNQIERLVSVPRCFDVSTLLLRENPLSQISLSFFNQVPNIQVLDMSYSGITEMPPSVCNLAQLRVLFLQYSTSLKKLPSLEKLKKLQVLNLRGTLIKKLPEGLEGLVSLRSLDLSETVRLEYIHDGVISSLSILEELRMQGSHLCKMDFSSAANCFKEIRCLKHLAILTLSAVGCWG